jgi:hypothetical protein
LVTKATEARESAVERANKVEVEFTEARRLSAEKESGMRSEVRGLFMYVCIFKGGGVNGEERRKKKMAIILIRCVCVSFF